MTYFLLTENMDPAARAAFDRDLEETPDQRERREVMASNEAMLDMMGGLTR